MSQVSKRHQQQAELTSRRADERSHAQRSRATDRAGGTPPRARPSTRRQANRRRSSPLFSLAIIGAVVLGLVAVVHAVASGGGTTSGSAGNASSGSAGAPASAGQVAPAFTLTTLAGAPFVLAGARGHPIVLYFMATTCSTCVQGSQNLAQAVQSAHVAGAQAVAIDVNAGDTRSDLASFVQVTGVPASAPVVWGVDTQDRIAQAYGVQTLETTVVIDAQGHIAYENPGPVAPQQLAQIIQKAA